MTAPAALSPEGATVAAAPMYDLPELHGANDALWRGIAGHLAAEGMAAPGALTRDLSAEALCAHPGLLLTQTCGYPLMTAQRTQVQVVATPRYRAAGCVGAYHRSAVIVPSASAARTLADLRGGRCAVNDMQSNTGMNLLRAELSGIAAGQPMFSRVLVTGAHIDSLGAIASGAADVAAIDGVTFAHARRLRPRLVRDVRVLGWTRSSPNLPLVTSARATGEVLAALRRALRAVAADRRLDPARRALLLDGFSLLPRDRYSVVLRYEQEAAARGYPRLQ